MPIKHSSPIFLSINKTNKNLRYIFIILETYMCFEKKKTNGFKEKNVLKVKRKL